MTDAQQLFLMIFGAVLAIVGILVFFLLAWYRETFGGQNVLKVLQAEFRFSHPALLIFLVGVGVMVFPFFMLTPLPPLPAPPQTTPPSPTATPTPTNTPAQPPPPKSPTVPPTPQNGLIFQREGEHNVIDPDGKRFITPRFTVLELTSPIPPDGAGNVLVGSADEVEIIVTSDEDLSDRPNVALFYVECRDFETDCSTAMTSYAGANVTDIGTNRWRILIDPLRRTGYHSVYIFGKDGSPNQNLGGVGISPSIISDGAGRGFFMPNGTINDNALYFEVDLELPNPQVLIGGKNAKDSPNIEFVDPLFIQIDFTKPFDPDSSQDHETLTEGEEYHGDNFDEAVITLFALDGFNMTHQVSTTDGRRFLVGIDNISLGAHSILLNAMDEAGNKLMSTLFFEFEIFEPPPFEITLLPGWNLVSFPAAPLDPDMNAVFFQGVPVTTVYTFDPSVPGGWLVAVRDTPDDPWFGDLTGIDPERGFWVLSDEIYELQVDLEAVSVGSYNLLPGWNLIGVSVSGDSPEMDVKQYLSDIQSEWGSIQYYDTILARWLEVDGNGPSPPDSLDFPGLPPSDPVSEFGTVAEGKAYLIFVESAVVLVPP